MTTEAWISVAVLVGAIALFVSDRLRLDVVALLALLTLSLTGVLDAKEALAGFSNSIVIMIAGLFVVGAGLSETGVADWLGRKLGALGGSSEVRLLVVLMLTTAGLSGFMSSTGTVAVLLPVAVTIATRAGIPPARLLLPMAFSSLLGGMLTLIGTPPNIVVSNALRASGREGFRFFTFLAPGLVMLTIGVLFMVLVGRKLLGGRPTDDKGEASPQPASRVMRELVMDYGVSNLVHIVEVPKGCGIEGRTLADANLRADLGVTVVGLRDTNDQARRLLPQAAFQAGDIIQLQGEDDAVARACDKWGLLPLATHEAGGPELPDDESLAEVVIPRRSRLVGKSLRDARFRDRYRATVLALRRGRDGSPETDLRDAVLKAGDALLIKGRIKYLRRLRERTRELVVVTDPREPDDVFLRPHHARYAVAVTLGMLVLMTFGIVPNVMAVMLAGLGMVLTGCVTAREAYRSINWESVVLIAGILPLATAMEKSGAIGVTVDQLVALVGGYGPVVVLIALFVLTSFFSQVISNTATTVLVAPIAIQLASGIGVLPEPLLITVAIAASTAFSTPIASPVNTIVLGPGGYKFADFFRVGVPLQLLLLVATAVVVPLLFPFH